MQGPGGLHPPEAIGFCYYNTKIIPNARFRAYLSKYNEVFNQIWCRGVVGVTPWKT